MGDGEWVDGRVEEMMEEGGTMFGKQTRERVSSGQALNRQYFSTPSLAILIHWALDFGFVD